MNDRAPDPKGRRHPRKRRADRRGVALVMVLGAITVLTVFLTELQEETSSELSSALAERDAVRAEYYARSAINLSRLLIAMEPNITKSIPFVSFLGLKQLPVWKYQDMVLGPFNDTESGKSFTGLINADPSTGKNLGLSGGRFELNIIDEDSKFNLNTAADVLPAARNAIAGQLMGLMSSTEYNPLFEGRDLDNQFSDRQTICGAIIDWADSSTNGNEELATCDVTSKTNTATGTEDNFYEMIGLGYRRKNAAYDSLNELRLVRGISDDFWATFVDPDPTNPDKRIMTIWGQGGKGQVNLNTAPPLVILSVICTDDYARVEFCADQTQVLPFLELLTMAKAILPPGVPLFATPQKLTKFLKTGGQPDGQPPNQPPNQGGGSRGGQQQGQAGGQKGVPGLDLSDMLLPMFSSMLSGTLKPVRFKAEKAITDQFTNKPSRIFSIYADGVVPGFRRTTKIRIHAVVDFRKPAGSTPGTPGTPPNPAGNVIYWRVE